MQNNTKTPFKIFVDLDGVLVSLFDAVSLKLFNKTHKQLTPEEKTEAKKIWYDRAHFNDNFGDVEKFFATLPPFGEHGELTKAIIDTVVEFAGSYTICSHPAGIDPEACKRGKIDWIKKHLNPQPAEMVFPQSKATYATSNGVPNILIDDFPPYIKAWEAAKGIPIQMRTDDFHSVEQVKSSLTKELEAAKKRIEDELTQKESFDSLYEKYLEVFRE
jgi:hypothetical protein